MDQGTIGMARHHGSMFLHIVIDDQRPSLGAYAGPHRQASRDGTGLPISACDSTAPTPALARIRAPRRRRRPGCAAGKAEDSGTSRNDGKGLTVWVFIAGELHAQLKNYLVAATPAPCVRTCSGHPPTAVISLQVHASVHEEVETPDKPRTFRSAEEVRGVIEESWPRLRRHPL